MAEVQPVKATTPKGTAIYPRLNSPDDKYVAEGEYKVKLAFDAEDPDFIAFRERVEKMVDEVFDAKVAELKADNKGGLASKLVKQYPFTVEEDAATGDETGRILINSRMKASGTGKKGPWTRKPTIFNARGVALKSPPMVGGGSTLKLSVQLAPYYVAKDKTVGVSTRLEAVQLINLVTGGARSASDYGFGEEEGDDVDDVAADSPFAGSTDDGDEDDDI